MAGARPICCLERDDKKWEPVFVPKSRDNKNLERTFDSIKCHPALADRTNETCVYAIGNHPRQRGGIDGRAYTAG